MWKGERFTIEKKVDIDSYIRRKVI
jgi:hypothetical protein